MTAKAFPLPKGHFVTLDEQDAHLLLLGSWHAVRAAQRDERFYVAANIKETTVYLHRLILQPPAGMTVDHRNGDGLDNSRANLRLATRSQNNANKRCHAGGTGFRGVLKQLNRYRAVISAPPELGQKRRRIHLGSFLTAEEAARAWDAAALERWGEFARLNFPTTATTGEGA